MSSPLALHSLFSDFAVLPRDVPLPIAGKALPGQPVRVSFAGRQVSVRANVAGRWEAMLDPLPAGGPHILSVSSSVGQLIRRNIMIGEVWLAAGGAGMAVPMRKCEGGVAAIKRVEMDRLRLFAVPESSRETPSVESEGRWRECTIQTAAEFSAVALHFGQTVASATECAVGLIQATVPDAKLLGWIPGETRRSQSRTEVAAPPPLRKRTPRWASFLARREPPAAVEMQNDPAPTAVLENAGCAMHFNAMIAPLTRLPLQGVLWQQGEGDIGDAASYRDDFITMIGRWRVAWQQDEMPFLFVQLPGVTPGLGSAGGNACAELREAQMCARDLPATAMIVSADQGEVASTGARKERLVAQRLALAALAVAHHRSMPYSGPVVEGFEVEDQAIRVRFGPPGVVVRSRKGRRVEGFAIAGADRRFVIADARVEDDSVLVSSTEVWQPEAVRYGWSANPVLSLEDGSGLPLPPFRTDDWAARKENVE